MNYTHFVIKFGGFREAPCFDTFARIDGSANLSSWGFFFPPYFFVSFIGGLLARLRVRAIVRVFGFLFGPSRTFLELVLVLIVRVGWEITRRLWCTVELFHSNCRMFNWFVKVVAGTYYYPFSCCYILVFLNVDLYVTCMHTYIHVWSSGVGPYSSNATNTSTYIHLFREQAVLCAM